MKAGESFALDDENGRKTAHDVAQRLGIRITTQKQEDGTYVIWRVE